jgi:hypothetical protein
MKVKLLFAALLFLTLIFPALAAESSGRFSWFFVGSIMVFPEDNDMASDPMPVLPSPGIGFTVRLTSAARVNISLEPGFDFYTTHYAFNEDLKRPVPAATENRSAMVIGSVMSLPVVLTFSLSGTVTLSAFAGPAADLRLAFVALDLDAWEADRAIAAQETALVQEYFWSEGRWFLPLAGLGIDFVMNDRFKLGFDLRVWAPAYRLWTGEDLPPIEGWRFGSGLKLIVRPRT